MATTTPSFGWPVPTSTDLVKDGATAIESLGDAIDSSMADLKGGTTGQVLSKASNTDMDFTWVAQDDSNAIQNAIVDAKGDLIGATAADTPARLAVGTNGQVLTADSSASTGLAWATPTAANGPAFGAYRATNQSVAGSTWTKIQINTEEFDTDSCYDSSTNYRFTPTKAGIYQVNFTVKDSGGDMIAAIYKNGSEFKRLWEGNIPGLGNTGGVLMSFNGSTDYVEFYYLHYSGTADITGGQSRTYASATWIRSN